MLPDRCPNHVRNLPSHQEKTTTSLYVLSDFAISWFVCPRAWSWGPLKIRIIPTPHQIPDSSNPSFVAFMAPTPPYSTPFELFGHIIGLELSSWTSIRDPRSGKFLSAASRVMRKLDGIIDGKDLVDLDDAEPMEPLGQPREGKKEANWLAL